jgi:rhamnosyl/mannosyltransferase
MSLRLTLGERFLKVLEIATNAPPYKGGVSRLVGILFEGLMSRGHSVQVLTPKTRFKELSFSSIPFQQHDGYNVIHLHGPTPFLSDLTLITNSKYPIVYTHHCEPSWISEKVSKVYRVLHRFLARRAKVIIVHSDDYARLFREVHARVEVIRIPCTFKPVEVDFSQKPDVFTVLFVGQFRPYKGIDVLLKAASALKDVDFILTGEGRLKPKYLALVKALGLSNVRILNGVDDNKLIDLYRRAHVICLPSVNTSEAYGLCLLEGALYGCLPLASDLPGVRENVSNLKGLLLEPKSHVSLIEKIRMLSSDRKKWAILARSSQSAALNYASLYTPEYYVEKHEEVFRDVVSMR